MTAIDKAKAALAKYLPRAERMWGRHARAMLANRCDRAIVRAKSFEAREVLVHLSALAGGVNYVEEYVDSDADMANALWVHSQWNLHNRADMALIYSRNTSMLDVGRRLVIRTLDTQPDPAANRRIMLADIDRAIAQLSIAGDAL